MFGIELTSEAVNDLEALRKYDQQRVTDELQDNWHTNLPAKPGAASDCPNSSAEWELRLGSIRVFCDVEPDASVVRIVAIGVKTGNRLFVHGEEFDL
jgi:mRNA-degrading endonuclease RelE of RelBE toxin-antitoxin system